jgi:hypothetical protein
MTYWEFLIQREGDRGWRSIKTGNLQLTEGRYRIIVKSDLPDTTIQTRATHQTLTATVPQRRSQSRNLTTNASGLLVIVPFTYLHSGIWQFVCSGIATAQTGWHRILKLRVLPKTPVSSSLIATINPRASTTRPTQQPKSSPDRDLDLDDQDLATPTQPLVPISMTAGSANWADGLDRLLEQIERESLQSHDQQPVVNQSRSGSIQLHPIIDRPLQLISLDRSTFSGIIPGNQLTISGACNLNQLTTKLVQAVKIEKISICLRHPQTSAIIVSIERSLPLNFDTFAFRGQLELPIEPKISLLRGEVNLYDRHYIQVGSIGFTVTLNLNPLNESELSLLQLFDHQPDDSAATLSKLTQELQIEPATISGIRQTSTPTRSGNSSHPNTRSTIKPSQPAQYPTAPLAYQRESLFTHPDITPVNANPDHPTAVNRTASAPSSSPSSSHFQHLLNEITGDLEIDFGLSKHDRSSPAQLSWQLELPNDGNLEIVIDD